MQLIVAINASRKTSVCFMRGMLHHKTMQALAAVASATSLS